MTPTQTAERKRERRASHRARAPATRPRIRADAVRALAAAEQHYSDCKRALDAAKTLREGARARLRDRVPAGEEIVAAGFELKRVIKSTGRSFRLKDFLAKHKPTKAMEPFISEPSQYETWRVKELEA